MYPSKHIFYGLLASLILFFFIPQVNFLAAAIFFFSSFLIDFDHYLYFVFKEKNLSLKKALNWFKAKRKKYLALSETKRKNTYTAFCIFHGAESLLFFLVLGYFVSNYFYFVSLGIFFHLCLDLFESRIIFHSPNLKHSVLHAFFKIKKLIYLK